MNEKYPDRESCVAVRVLDLAEVIPLAQNTQDLGTHGFLSGNDEVGMAEANLDKGGAVIEACVQQKKIAFFEEMDEFVNEFMFRSACLSIDEAQGRTAD